MFESIEALAVLVAALFSVAVGSIWYSPLLFRNTWLTTVDTDVSHDVLTSRNATVLTIKSVLVQIVFFLVVSSLVTRLEDTQFAIVDFALCILILMLVSMMSLMIWEKRSFLYFLVHAGYLVISLVSGMVILIFWPW